MGQRNQIHFDDLEIGIKNIKRATQFDKEEEKIKVINRNDYKDLKEKVQKTIQEDISYFRYISLNEICSLLNIKSLNSKLS